MVQDLEARLAAALEGRYEMRGLLGHGGMGAVFLAAETSLDRLVAIKVLPPSLSMDEELLTRFQREAKTAARLDHPGIVPIYAVEDILEVRGGPIRSGTSGSADPRQTTGGSQFVVRQPAPGGPTSP